MGMIVVLVILLSVPVITWRMEGRDNSRSVEIWDLIREAKENEKHRQQRNQRRRMQYAGAHFEQGR